MKKLFFVMAAVAALLTSCSKDETFGGPTRGKVTFEVSTPELATRAYGDGTTADNLYYAVYDVIENAMVKTNYATSDTTDDVTFGNDLKATVTIDLVEGRPYEVAFWAESPESPYVFKPGEKKVCYKQIDNLTANNEAYDAFFAYVPKEDVKVGQVVNVDLKRPFAQLNVATNDAETAKKLGVEVKATGIKVDAYTSFNLETGAVTGSKEELTFAMTVVDDAATTATEYNIGTITANSNNYDWLTMNYILVNERETTDVTFLFEDTKGKDDYERPYSSINVQRNHRTNIIGAILTDPTQFDVTIDKVFTTPDINEERGNRREVSSAEEVVDAFGTLIDDDPDNDVDVIVFDEDINLNDLGSLITYDNSAALSTTTRAGETSYGLLIPAGKTLTLDLNGFTISQEKGCTASYSMIDNKGNLTIMDSSANGDGKISFKDTSAGDPSFGWGSYTISNNGGTLVVENGKIEHLGEQNNAQGVSHMYCAIFQYSGSTTINGGTISTPTYRSVRLWKDDMTINGGNFEGQVWVQAVDDSSDLTINGGTFAPCGADRSSLFVTNIDQKGVEHNVAFSVTGGTFTTKIGMSKPIAAISGGTFHDASVFNFLADDAEIDLGTDIEATDVITLDKSVKVNGNDHSINSSASRVFRVIANDIDVEFNNFNINATSTVKGNGSNPDSIRGISIDSGIKNVALTLNDCDVKFTDDEVGKDWAYAVNLTSGGSDNTITINGGKYEGANVINIHSPKTTVNIDGATLTSLYPDYTSCYGACIMVVQSSGAKDCNVTIKNSTFNGNNAIALNIVNSENTVVEENNTNNCSTNIVYGESTKFTTFEKAIETSQAISLVGNMTLSKSITIPTDKNIILDLNGNVLSGVNNAGQGHLIMVNNGASLTIKDSSADESGKITYAKGSSDIGWTIDLEGELNLESGTIELTGDNWSIGYAVDVRPNSWGTEYQTATIFNMTGGKLVSSDGAVRVASSSADTHSQVAAHFNMTGGEIEAAYDGIFFQQSNAAYDNLNLNISAGTINANMYPVRIYGPVATSKVGDSSLKISGGTFKKVVNTKKVQLVEGLLYIAGGVAADTLYYTDIEVTGGSFDDGEALPAYSMDAKAPATSNVE